MRPSQITPTTERPFARSPASPGRVIVVGGIDPGGGAGLLRDVSTARSLGAPVHAVGTAWTEQAAGIHRVEPRAPAAVREALAQALAAGAAAVKIGMAVGPATAGAILEALIDFDGPVVVDPVLATSRGGALWDGTPAELLPLLHRATLATPNAPKAGALAGRPAADAAGAEAAGRALVDSAGLRAVLVKGGHLAARDGQLEDLLLMTAGEARRFPHPLVPGPSPRGTGCALATAIAVELARGRALPAAVGAATGWLGGAIAAARSVGDGEHHLPDRAD